MLDSLYRSIRYATTVCKHKAYVFLGAARVGRLPLKRVLFHDISKFYPSEFMPYRDKFEPESIPLPAVQERFNEAWKKHYTRNQHHWQYWVSTDSNKPPEPMPETYVREMVADWIAASLAYQKNKPFSERLDILPWVRNNLPRMNLHKETRAIIIRILLELGYTYTELPSDEVGNLRYSINELQKFRQDNASW